MGTAHAESGRRGEALLRLTMAEQVATTSIDNPYEKLRALIGAAEVQRESGRLELASRGYEQALGVARNAEYPLGIAHALAGLAGIAALRPGDIQQAHGYAEEAVTLYRSLGADTEAAKPRESLPGPRVDRLLSPPPGSRSGGHHIQRKGR
ncbi:hypothetical protein KBY47_05255 [Streptomyces sp. B93]|nr:hypothetical protein [Streptomyces sp. B93]